MCCCVWLALSTGTSRAVEKVRIAVREAEVKFTLIPPRRMGVDLEQWAREERDYFREVFGPGTFNRSVVEDADAFGAGTTCKVPAVLRISTFARTFFSSTEASHPESLIIEPRNWLKFLFWPTIIKVSKRETRPAVYEIPQVQHREQALKLQLPS